MSITCFSIEPCCRYYGIFLFGDCLATFETLPKVAKSSQNSLQSNKIFTTLLNLKVQIKPLMKPQNTYNIPCFGTAYLDQNVIIRLKQKVSQNLGISLGYFICSKNIMSFQK
jgi:hypothetical protein